MQGAVLAAGGWAARCVEACQVLQGGAAGWPRHGCGGQGGRPLWRHLHTHRRHDMGGEPLPTTPCGGSGVAWNANRTAYRMLARLYVYGCRPPVCCGF